MKGDSEEKRKENVRQKYGETNEKKKLKWR
jgi:hypothetical protein